MAGIYIHIPFCKQACNYCNFHFSTSLNYKEDFVKALNLEIALQKDYLGDSPLIESLYFGGGTPSLLQLDELNQIVDQLARYFDLSQLKECTLEANPDDLDLPYLKALNKTLVNRLSIGVQSFFEEDLVFMHRAHNAQQADYAVKAAQDSGFATLSIDLIYGVPGLSNERWIQNLQKAKALEVVHLSAYALTVEPKTALHYQVHKKKSCVLSQEQAAQQMELLLEQAPMLGFEAYEISNFAQKQQYALHNTNYWRGKPYLGLGPSAHSYDGHSRQYNVANNHKYIQTLLKEQQLCFEKELLSTKQKHNEYVMTALRTQWGIDLEKVQEEWGVDAVNALMQKAQKGIRQGSLSLNEQYLVLTLQGRLFADALTVDLWE